VKVHALEEMTRGWFVGDFEPTAYRTKEVEVAVKHYTAGDTEARHVHRVASELTAVISGRIVMGGRELGPGELLVIDPGEPSEFEAMTDAVIVCVKVPAVPGDKYLVED
jgi:mannose-6-phosphate isomerase-like protein (cupin superfamily)